MRVTLRSSSLPLALLLLLIVQLAGPAMHALDHHDHHPRAHEPAPEDHDASDCNVCHFVAGHTPQLPRPVCLIALAPTVEHLITRVAATPRPARFTSAPARAPPAWL